MSRGPSQTEISGITYILLVVEGTEIPELAQISASTNGSLPEFPGLRATDRGLERMHLWSLERVDLCLPLGDVGSEAPSERTLSCSQLVGGDQSILELPFSPAPKNI